jgi:hypothetical protein
MPRIILGKNQPPANIQLPEGKGDRDELLLLPGQPKKVTEVELQHIQNKYPALKIHVLPKKPSELKGTRPKVSASSSSSATSSASSAGAGKTDSGDKDDKNGSSSKKKRR